MVRHSEYLPKVSYAVLQVSGARYSLCLVAGKTVIIIKMHAISSAKRTLVIRWSSAKVLDLRSIGRGFNSHLDKAA